MVTARERERERRRKMRTRHPTCETYSVTPDKTTLETIQGGKRNGMKNLESCLPVFIIEEPKLNNGNSFRR